MLVSTRNSLARALTIGALAAVTGGLLAGCGSDDSTASSTPTLTTHSKSAPAPETSIEVPPFTTPAVAATAPPETPQAVPSGFPGPTEAPALDDRGKAYLDALKKGGIAVADNGDIAIVTANYICGAKVSGANSEEVTAYVTGMAGAEASITGATMTPEQAAAAAQVYIDAANNHYCK
ncbi:DUF732 domain-containing protein [Rhodococcus oryzae]|uniref:DUF732 domain-containing protein n=1 Tax=Rhodococcus oryzae TaxID=2571143 RepID=A0ABY2RDF1_9NOCA|nr:DUF732 domain-containing protein [Rhodococcus oryzae]TJZ73622.1 DUF732 domain-containing protein [Rhodococcus oryzae]